ncbi:hypothetical protein B194_4373 [Serratia plymuthica A30]|nr:hypothetical protein B194_4373 [Serratia plymuthica A30]
MINKITTIGFITCKNKKWWFLKPKPIGLLEKKNHASINAQFVMLMLS